MRDIGLGDGRLEAVGLEFLLAKASRKEATQVISSLQINDKGTLEFGLSKNHVDALFGFASAAAAEPQERNYTQERALRVEGALSITPTC